MEPKVQVTETVIYVDRPLTEAEQASTNPRYVQGVSPGHAMADQGIKADDVRQRLKLDEGNLCVGVEPGDEFGELHISWQFEGPKDTGKGEPEICMSGQNDLLIKGSEWLRDLLGNLGADFEVAIDAEPCPKAVTPLRLTDAVARLEGTVEVEGQAEVGRRIQVERRIDRG